MALGGVLAALAVALMSLGGLIPIATFLSPMLASLLLLFLLRRLPRGACVGWYAVVSILSVLLCPDKESAFVFVFLGYYPICKPGIDKLPALPRILVKLLLFNGAVAAMYGILIFLFRMEELLQEAKAMRTVILIVLLLLGNLTFFLYDLFLKRAAVLIRRRF